jgi:hypothetical protein
VSVAERWSRAPRAPGRCALTSTEGALLVILAVWSLLPLAILFVHGSGSALSVGAGGRFFTGADFPDVPDQLQYLAWIRDAGNHILISNRFDLRSDPHLFLHPAFLLSGLAWKLGASLQLAYLAWRPIWVVLLLLGFAAYVRRLVEPGAGARGAALVLALFMLTITTTLFDGLGLGGTSLRFGVAVMGLEVFPGDYVLGPGAAAVALMPLFLLGLECIVDPSRRRSERSTASYVALTSIAGLAVSWFHPWQGLTLLVLVFAVTIWARLWGRVRVLAIPVLATLAPLVYYEVLSRTHSAWRTVSASNNFPHFGDWFFLAMIPLLVLAAPFVDLPRLRGGQPPAGDPRRQRLASPGHSDRGGSCGHRDLHHPWRGVVPD